MSCNNTCLLDWNSPARVVNVGFLFIGHMTLVNNICLWIKVIIPPLSNKVIKTL